MGRSADRLMSLATTITATSGMASSWRRAAGGGSDVMAADQPARMPPQASIALSETLRGATEAAISPAGCCRGAATASQHDGSTSSDRSSRQQSVGGVAVAVQHDGSAGAAEQQHDSADASAAAEATRCRRTSSVAGSTRLASAQAISSAGELQQQLEKHCSAVAQPQGLSMQGKGRERSFPASRLAAGEPGPAGAGAIGSGTPEATST